MPRADRSNSKAKSFRHMPTDVPDWEQKLTVLSFKRRRPNIPAPLLVVGKEKQDLCHTCYGDGCFWQREVVAGRIPRYPPAKDQKSQDSAAKHGVSICIAPSKFVILGGVIFMVFAVSIVVAMNRREVELRLPSFV